MPKGPDPLLRRLRSRGGDPAPFRGRQSRAVLWGGIVLLVALGAVGLRWPVWAPVVERLANLLALAFLLAAVGLWLRMGVRAFAVSGVLVLGLYGLTAWTRLTPLRIEDFFVVALVAALGVFALAGFNLVFILEEMVWDAHRLLHPRGTAWQVGPTALVVALATLLPVWDPRGGPHLPALWATSLACTVLLTGWWFLRALNDFSGERALRELHLFVLGALAAALLADTVWLLREGATLVPSLFAFAALVATWVFVSYTTLQRTHFLLAGRNALPWMAILLATAFSVLGHVQAEFGSRGAQVVADLADERVGYLVAGVWIGIAFYVLRSLADASRAAARVLRGPGRAIAVGTERVTQGILDTEARAAEAALRFYKGVGTLLPGARGPARKGWEVDAQGAAARPLDEEE